jgi:hypothetical protein
MKPQKKKAHPSEQPKVPPHLSNYVIREKPPASCPWSLSGPQFPQPTAIQQRYCYPKGDPEYSSRKGGALWTMYAADGKENLDYRLLHVYFSAKRAVNKGLKLKSAASNKASSNKRVKRSPPRSKLPVQQPPMHPGHPQLQQQQQMMQPMQFHPMAQQQLSRDCNSPLSFEIAPPSPTISPIYKSNFVSPHVFETGSFHSPFRPREIGLHVGDATMSTTTETASSAAHDDDDHSFADPLQWDADMDARSMQELEDACWTDPLFSSSQPPPPQQDGVGVEAMRAKLAKVHSQVCAKILEAPESEQALMVSLFTSWARQVAQDPLNNDAAMQQAQV